RRARPRCDRRGPSRERRGGAAPGGAPRGGAGRGGGPRGRGRGGRGRGGGGGRPAGPPPAPPQAPGGGGGRGPSPPPGPLGGAPGLARDLSRRLVWLVVPVRAGVRPRERGGLEDVFGEPQDLRALAGAGGRVRVAHPLELDPAELELWRERVAGDGVAQPFE